MKKILHHTMSLILLVYSFMLTGCFKNFYSVKTDTSYNNLETILKDPEKTVIVHFTDKDVELKSAEIDIEGIKGTIYPYTPARYQYAYPDESKKLQAYKSAHRKTVFSEVHVYVSIPKPAENNVAVIKKEEVVKYNIYKHELGASIGSHALGIVIVATSVAVAIAAFTYTAFAAGLMTFGSIPF